MKLDKNSKILEALMSAKKKAIFVETLKPALSYFTIVTKLCKLIIKIH